jgi:hypothetical protein
LPVSLTFSLWAEVARVVTGEVVVVVQAVT